MCVYISPLFQTIPDKMIGQSVEFERGLCDLIIWIAPFAPMFASELWRGVADVPLHMCTHYSWVSIQQLYYKRPLVTRNLSTKHCLRHVNLTS